MSANKKKRKRTVSPVPPPMPVAEIEKLRKAMQPGVIDPSRTYRIQLPNGKIHESTGLQMLQSAKAILDLADASRAGDPAKIREAVMRMMRSVE